MKDEERLIIYNQFSILEELAKLNNNELEAEDYRAYKEIIAKGYTYDYFEINNPIREEMSKEECKFVREVLNMYSSLNASFDVLKDKPFSKDKIEFKGFDGNYEENERWYCDFVIKTLKEYYELLNNNQFKDFNTHSRMKEKYKRMLEEYNKTNKYNLTADEIELVVNA